MFNHGVTRHYYSCWLSAWMASLKVEILIIFGLIAWSQLADSQLADSQTRNSQLADSQTRNSQLADSQTGRLADSQLADSQLADSQTRNSQLADSQYSRPLQSSNCAPATRRTCKTSFPIANFFARSEFSIV
jgi:hypothetical protein